MAKTIDQLLTQSSLIANETKAGANTALRVGGMFSDILYHLRDSDYAQKSDIPTKVSSFENDANYATTSDLDARIDALVNGAPAAYDTLKEIADVLGKNVDSIADILDALGTKANKVDVDAAISAVNASISALNTELSGKIDLKLDAATFNELFEKVLLEDGKTYAIRAKLGLFSDSFLSAKGANASGGSSTGGAGALYQLADVAADGQQVSGAATGALLMYNGTQWQGVSQSEIVPNLTGYAKLTDIPTDDINKGVTAYGWGDHSKVGYLTGITSALVTGALGFTPFDSANFTKAKIKSTLGISDWALASSKPSYTTTEVTEGDNLYFTNARAVSALKSITDSLGSDISTLQGYFTNGVAKSAARLSTNTAYKAWGQTFFENGVPKAVSGALTDVTDITSSGTITTNKIVIGNGAIEWDETNKGFKIVGGLYTETYLSSKGANPNGGSSSGGGLITSLYRYADLGKTFADTSNDTFNAYTINKINADLGSRISVLEGKATNVTYTANQTSGTLLGTLTIDGASKNIYAPTIPTDDINKGVTAHGWGNHASVGYLTSASNLAWGKITGTPTTLGGYGITDWSVKGGDYDVNGRYDAGYYMIINGSNAPTRDSYGSLLVMPYRKASGNTTPDFATQIFLPNGDDSGYPNDMFFRTSLGSSWNAWQRVLTDNNYTNYIYSKSTIDTKLSGYLPLSGGTIKGDTTSSPLIINTASTKEVGVRLEMSGVAKGWVGYTSGTGIYLYSYGTNGVTHKLGISDSGAGIIDSYALIHTGNIGSQSVDNASKLGGKSATEYYQTYGSLPTNKDLATLQAGAYWVYENLGLSSQAKSTYSSLCVLGNAYYSAQLNVVHDASRAWLRGVYDSNSVSDWHELAFTDSNVASATKLQTARSIWGQSFDGTGDVSGALNNVGNINFGANSTYNIGSNTNQVLYIYARWIGSQTNSPFGIGAAGAYHLSILTNGNVGIGTTSPSYKLDVNGSGRFGNILINKGHGSYVGDNTIEMDTAGLTLYMQYYHNGGINMCYGGGTVTMGGALNVKKAATFDGVTSIGAAQPQYDANRAQLSVISTANMPAMLWLGSSGEKKWSVESRGEADSYRFSLYSWVAAKHILKIEHTGVATLDGTFNATTGIWSDGYVSAKGQNTSSDMRLKNVLNEVVLGVKDIANAPSVRFAWKNGGGVDVGSIAQYWQGLLPDAVKERDGMLEMQYANIALLSAIAIAKRVETHEERIARLERENKELRTKIDMMERRIA